MTEEIKFTKDFISETGLQYHIRLKPGDIPGYVLLPGDPGRVLKIVKYWDEAVKKAEHRQYITYAGKYKGVPIAVTSTGIGGPAVAIAVEELARVGAHTFIRVGSTGAIQPEIKCGDLIISTGAVRFDGASKQYVRVEYPAVASYEVVLALIEACESLGFRYHVGITVTSDSFYTGEGRPGFKGYWQSFMDKLVDDLRRARALNFEMEAATLFTLANLFGLRAGAICAVYDNMITEEVKIGAGEEDAIRAANEAVKILFEWDNLKRELKKKYFYPSLLRRVIK